MDYFEKITKLSLETMVHIVILDFIPTRKNNTSINQIIYIFLSHSSASYH